MSTDTRLPKFTLCSVIDATIRGPSFPKLRLASGIVRVFYTHSNKPLAASALGHLISLAIRETDARLELIAEQKLQRQLTRQRQMPRSSVTISLRMISG